MNDDVSVVLGPITRTVTVIYNYQKFLKMHFKHLEDINRGVYFAKKSQVFCEHSPKIVNLLEQKHVSISYLFNCVKKYNFPQIRAGNPEGGLKNTKSKKH